MLIKVNEDKFKNFIKSLIFANDDFYSWSAAESKIKKILQDWKFSGDKDQIREE
jgi:hypothetical protein